MMRMVEDQLYGDSGDRCCRYIFVARPLNGYRFI
jgi:hypothetical protein